MANILNVKLINKTINVLLLAVILILLPALVKNASALNESTAAWRILTTGNFEIYYHNKDDGFAREAGRIAEAALVEISAELNVKSISGRIPVVLYDFSDAPYGFTNILQNKMFVSIAQPEAAELSDKTWIESIIRHELTHYVMGTKFDNKIKFGTGRILGWGLLPMWFIEGVAQREESSWNAIKDSAIRTALLSQTFLNLQELQVFYFFNYHGRRLGYHIGNSIVNFMVEKFGKDTVPRIIENTNYSINGFNRAVKKVTGKSMGEIFTMWQNENGKKYQKQVEGKKSIDELQKPMTSFPGLNVSPQFDCAGTNMYFLSNRGRDARRLSLFCEDMKTGHTQQLIENIEDNYFLDEANQAIYFSRKIFDRYDNLKSDIFKYDIKSREVTRLTKWLKMQNPVFDRRDGNIYGIVNGSGTTNVCKIGHDGKIIEHLTDIKYDSAIYELHMPAGREAYAGAADANAGKSNSAQNAVKDRNLLFLNYFKNGKFSIAYLDCDKKAKNYGKITPLTFFDEMILKPSAFVEADGSYRVFFIKDENGIFNIYSLKLKVKNGDFAVSEYIKLTDLRESVIDFDYCPKFKRLAVVTQTAGGSKITILDSEKIYCIESNGGTCSREFTAAAKEETLEIMFSGGGKTVAENGAAVKLLKPSSLNEAGTKDTAKGEIHGYKNNMKLEYAIPMMGSQSSKSLYGIQGRMADPINRHIFDFQALTGGKYRNLSASYMYRGFAPTLGILTYDIVRDLRQGVRENLKGTDAFANFKIFDSNLTATVFDREISANSISPLLEIRVPALMNASRKDRGYSLKFIQYRPENTVDADIHPINAHYFMAFHQNSSARFNSFFQYRINRFDASKWMLLSERLKNTVRVRAYGGQAFGDYDFQIGGYNDLRGYSSATLVGKKMFGYSLEYSHSGISEPVKLKIFNINRIYPAVFYDAAAAYNDGANKRWFRSGGIELKARLLLFKKTPILGKIGVAKRLDFDKGKEFYSAFELKF